MWNKLFASLLLGIFSIASIPSAKAADIPVLSWERGKEHNIVLGGNSSIKQWQISLISKTQNPIKFRASTRNPNGYVVYSINVPSNYPVGVYTVQTEGSGTPKTIVAGVNLVNLTNYNYLQIPVKLFIILLVLLFIHTTLSTFRMQKYERIEYLSAAPPDQLPPVIGNLYRLRLNSIGGLSPSLLKFLLNREGELLHSLSPSYWAAMPIFSGLFGIIIGAQTKTSNGVSQLSLGLYLLVAFLGILDPYSGLMATFGFAFSQTITGNVTSVRAIMALMAVGLAWVAPGLVSSLHREMLDKDNYNSRLKRFLPGLFAGAIGGLLFLIAGLLTNSFADQVGVINIDNLSLPFLIAFSLILRIYFDRRFIASLHLSGRKYQVRSLVLPRLVSPKTAMFAALYFAGASYVWTGSVVFSILIGALFAAPVGLLLVRFKPTSFAWLAKFERNALAESTLICIIAFLMFTRTDSAPLDVMQKGRLFMIEVGVLALLHAIYSSFYDSSVRDKVLQL